MEKRQPWSSGSLFREVTEVTAEIRKRDSKPPPESGST